MYRQFNLLLQCHLCQAVRASSRASSPAPSFVICKLRALLLLRQLLLHRQRGWGYRRCNSRRPLRFLLPPRSQIPAAHSAAAPPAAMPHFQPAGLPVSAGTSATGTAAVQRRASLQQYLPLILILNVFVLLVIVLILFFALRHK